MLGRQTQEGNTPLRRVPGTWSAGERRRGDGDGGERWTDVTEADLKRCNRCAEPFARRARRQDHGQDCSGGCGLSFVSTQTNRSWICTCTTCQRHLCTECHAKETGKTPILRATGSTVTPPTDLCLLSPTNTCCISSPSWTLSLCCKQSNG